MNRGRVCPKLLLALILLMGLVPSFSLAETVVFRNETPVPIIVQVSAVQRGVLKRHQHLVLPTQSTPKMPTETDQIILIFDAKTGRMLFRDVLKASMLPLSFGIIPGKLPATLLVVPRPLVKLP